MFKYFYKIFCILFSYSVSYFENIFLKIRRNNNNQSESNLLRLGYEKMVFPEILVEKIDETNVIKSNKYMKRIIISKEEIKKILNKIIIDLKLFEKITSITNFNYSIDYIVYYKNISINNKDQHLEWYANHWHKDKPMSRNSLKIIFPLKKISNLKHGGIKILDIKNSKNFLSLSEHQKNLTSFKMISDINELVAFLPNLCFHKAGDIEDDYVREQIMIQLNPSKNWSINSKIYQKQFMIEPKFPFFSYFFDHKERLLK